jgi:hypothetical protein
VPFNATHDLNIGGAEGERNIDLAVTDLAGNFLILSEPLRILLDTSAPTLIDTIPHFGETVSRNMPVSFHFNEEIDNDSVDVRVMDRNGDEAPFVWNYTLSMGLEIRPVMKGYLTYTVFISGNLSDLVGNRIGDPITFSFNVTGIPPGSPENLTLSWDHGNVSLNWDPPTDEGDIPITEYFVYRIGVGTDWILIGNTSTRSFAESNVDHGSRYQYRVSAFNGMEEGSPSAQESITIPDPVNGDDDDDEAEEDDDEFTLNSKHLLIGIVLVLGIPFILIVYLFVIRRKEKFPEE